MSVPPSPVPPSLIPITWVFSAPLLLTSSLSLGCSQDGSGPPKDTTPPAAVEDLAATTAVGGLVVLTWTAPGDNGPAGQAAQYDIRYAETAITNTTWDMATRVSSPPKPRIAGYPEHCEVDGLPEGSWYFALKTADEAPNWSGLSNVVSATVIDTIAPGRVTDLAVAKTTRDGAILTWTAPGNDGGEGRATEYDLRYALAELTEETWPVAVSIPGVPSPDSAGHPESFIVTGLETQTTYFFAVKAADRTPNWSLISNSVSATPLDLLRLTDSPHPFGASGAAWSPDGQTLAFGADWIQQFRYQLYLIPADGGDPVRLTSGRDYDYPPPSWSPDGQRIVFVSEPESGMNPRELWITDATPGSQATRLIHHEGSNITSPAWSPDGTKIAYVAYTTTPTWTSEIYIVSAEGGAPVRWSEGTDQERNPAWSPDGTRIAFTSDRSGNYDIWVRAVEGGNAVQLTTDPAGDGHPSWSPDGSRIAFGSSRSGVSNIWIMEATGANPTQVTFDPVGVGNPEWSPDGNRISFITYMDSIADIWVLYLE